MKRLTDTEKWRDVWFRKLTPASKLLWLYLCDTCNNAGVVEIDMAAFSFFIGTEITKEHLAELGDRIQPIDESKIWIPRFVSFQFGEQLSPQNRVHASVIALLKSYGLSDAVKIASTNGFRRKRVTETYRKEIYELDEYACQWCGTRKSANELVIDHVMPVILGGNNERDNVVTACIACNSLKQGRHPLEFAVGRKPLDRLSKILDTLSSSLKGVHDEAKDKYKDNDKEKDPAEGVQGEKQPSRPVELPEHFPVSAKDAVLGAEQSCPDKNFITDTWNIAVSRGGRDARDVVIRSWPHYVATCWKWEQERRAKSAPRPNGAESPQKSSPRWAQIKALEEAISTHPANPQSVFMKKDPLELERAELRSMREKLKALKHAETQEALNG